MIESDYDDLEIVETELRDNDAFITPPETITDPPSIDEDIEGSFDNELREKKDYCRKKDRKGNMQINFLFYH